MLFLKEHGKFSKKEEPKLQKESFNPQKKTTCNLSVGSDHINIAK